MTIRVFISSVQSEFAEARQQLCDYIKSDALLGRYFVPFLFENLPAVDVTATQAYLTEAGQSDIYLGIYGEKYGYEDGEGVSPTEREYDEATAHHRYRMVFITDIPAEQRHPKEARFIAKIEQDVVRKSFDGYADLKASVYAALVRYLEEKEYLRMLPFDATLHPSATIDDIDSEKVAWFVDRARRKRGFRLTMSDGVEKILKHLNLMTATGRLTNAALLMFARDPQRFFISSEVKCAQFYSTVIAKPIASYQVARGTVFEVIDQAVAFVMSRINARVGTRHTGPEVDIEYEIPMEVVTESIVNAVTHRDYTSTGSVQVMLFSDRVEVWNPGRLPYGLTVAKLMTVHPSIPVNPLLATPIYLAGYIERLGTGTGDMIALCKKAGLEQPRFVEDEDFKVVMYRENDPSWNEKAPSLSKKAPSSSEKAPSQDEKAPSQFDLATATRHKISKRQQMVIDFCVTPKTANEIMEVLGVSNSSRRRKTYITDLVVMGLLRPLISDKRTSPHQQYISTQQSLE